MGIIVSLVSPGTEQQPRSKWPEALHKAIPEIDQPTFKNVLNSASHLRSNRGNERLELVMAKVESIASTDDALRDIANQIEWTVFDGTYIKVVKTKVQGEPKKSVDEVQTEPEERALVVGSEIGTEVPSVVASRLDGKDLPVVGSMVLQTGAGLVALDLLNGGKVELSTDDDGAINIKLGKKGTE